MNGGGNGALRNGAPGVTHPRGNRLLDALDAAEFDRLRPHLESIGLQAGQILGQTGQAIGWALFPCRPAVVSLVALDDDARTAEAASVGDEGMVGAVLATLPGPGQVQVQMPGPALRLPQEALDAALPACPGLAAAVAMHERALLAQALQSSVCAALHPVEARAARWLLVALDRVGHPDLPVTQEMLADMLGVRRTTVTRVVAQLSEKGLIRHRRSRVTVTDRLGLEGAACGCHAALVRRLRQVAPVLYPG